MKIQLFFLIPLITLLLGSCTEDLPLDMALPKATRTDVEYIENGKDLSRLAWWSALHSPELDALLSQALSCNNKIKSACAIIEQAEAQLKSAQFAWLPTLNYAAASLNAGTWNSELTPGPLLAPSAPFVKNLTNIRFNGYLTGFLPKYDLNILKNISNVKAAKASLAMQQAQVESIKLSIISQMAGTYFMLLSQREQLKAETDLSADLKQLKELEQIRFNNGATDIEAMLNLDQQIAMEEAKIPLIESVILQSENTIHLLLNQNPGPLCTHSSQLALNVLCLIPEELPSTVLKNRPDIMIALNNLKAASAQIGLSYSAFFPTISLTGLLGKASIDLSNLLKLSTNLWVIEASGVLKLLDASSYQNIKAAKAAFKALYYQYLDTLHTAFADVDNKLLIAEENKLSFLQTEAGYASTLKAYSIACIQYKGGKTDYRNVLNAKINLDKTLLEVIQKKAQLLDSIVQVYQSVAGGYAYC